MLLPYAPQYKHFAEDDGTAHGAYGHRIATLCHRCDQLMYVEMILRECPNTRQAIVQFWSADRDLGQIKRDLPCTLSWQFLVRNERLHMVCTMRSNDVWLGMPYDVYVNTCIQQLLANSLDLRLGTYTHNVGSMHLYDKNREAAQEAMYAGCTAESNGYDQRDKLSHARIAVYAEEKMRAGSYAFCVGLDQTRPVHELNVNGLTGVLRDAIIGVGCHWVTDVPFHSMFRSPALRSSHVNY